MNIQNKLEGRIKSFVDEVKKVRGLVKPIVRNDADGVPEILVYDVIDPFWGISPESIMQALSEIDAPVINIRIDSPGGVVTDGIAIMTALANHPAEIHTFNDGLAASMASVLMMSGSERTMSRGAWNMIHNPWGICLGDARDMRECAELLDKFGDELVNIYAQGTGLDREEIAEAMAAETWYNADESLENGFVDQIAEVVPEKSEDTSEASNFISAFNNAPDEVTERLSHSQKRTQVTRAFVEKLLADAGVSRRARKLAAKGAVRELQSQNDSETAQLLESLEKATNTLRGNEHGTEFN